MKHKLLLLSAIISSAVLETNCMLKKQELSELDKKLAHALEQTEYAGKAFCFNNVLQLIEEGASIETKAGGSTALHFCARTLERLPIKIHAATVLINKGADIHALDTCSNTPLHVAAENGQVEIMMLLISKGANVEACNRFQETPLHRAAKTGQLEAVKILLNAKADVNALNEDHTTPLYEAASYGTVYFCGEKNYNILPYIKTIQILLDHGAKVDIKDLNGKTTLDLIMGISSRCVESHYYKKKEIIEILLARGIKIDNTDNMQYFASKYLNETNPIIQILKEIQ